MIDEERLGEWRPSVPGIEVRTRRRSGVWMLEQRFRDGSGISEILQLPPDADHLDAQIAELRTINLCAPRIGDIGEEPVVFVDSDEWWSAWLPCQNCGGFRWRLPLRAQGLAGRRGSIERETARLLGYRALIVFGEERPEDNCPGCFDVRLDQGECQGEQMVWFSARHQDWHIRMNVGSDLWIDLPVGLPSWADRDDVEREARKLVEKFAPRPFDWEDGEDIV